MIKRYNNISLLMGVPGIIMQITGYIMSQSPSQVVLGLLIMIAGAGLLCGGLTFYAIGKGQPGIWGLIGMLGIIGIIVLACLPDRTLDGRT